MKKLLFIMMAFAALSCSGKFGKGGDNAAQYVREQVGNDKNVRSIEATEETDYYYLNETRCQMKLDSLTIRLAQIDTETYNKTVDIADEIREGIEEKNPAKAPGEMLKAYLVTITYKSTKTDWRLVIMDRDGVTPLMTMEEDHKRLENLNDKLNEYLVRMVTE